MLCYRFDPAGIQEHLDWRGLLTSLLELCFQERFIVVLSLVETFECHLFNIIWGNSVFGIYY